MPALLEEDPALPGVSGSEPAAGHLARAWRERTGGTVGHGMGHVTYVLDRVEPPANPPPGGARLATAAERDLLVEWTVEFAREAGTHGDDAAATVDRGLAQDHLWVWEDDGPMAMTGTFVPVDGVVRISQVYTPPASRRRGLGSALVAEVSERLLAAGARRCMLYADRENASTNAIYQSIGYRRVGEAQEYTFGG
jgi:predicted GNAT family acetyltransferase